MSSSPEASRTKRANIGCGLAVTPGWHNFDNSLSVRLARWPRLSRLLAGLGLLGDQQLEFIATARAQDIRWANSVRAIPLPDDSLEVVYTCHMLEHLSRGCHRFERNEKADAYRAAREEASVAICELLIAESAVADELLKEIEQTRKMIPLILEQVEQTRQQVPAVLKESKAIRGELPEILASADKATVALADAAQQVEATLPLIPDM